MRPFAPDALLVLLLALCAVIPVWPLLTDQMTIVDGDFTEEYFPVILTVVRAVQAGELPLWNPYSNGGQPLLADPQVALFYPATWLALSGVAALDGGSLIALERLVPLHLALAAAFAFVLGRVMLGSRLGAVAVAAAYTFSGFLTSYPIEQLPILRAATWFPLQIALVWLALDRAAWRWSIGAGIVFGLAILAGHPQTAFLEGVGTFVVAAGWIYLMWWERRDWRPAARAVVTLGLMLTVALGISAVQVLPTSEFVRVSNRSEVNFGFLAGGFTLWELPMDLAVPRILGGHPPYVGAVSLVLAAIAIACGKARIRGIALALALVGLVLSTGAHTFAYAALYNLLPGFGIFRGQERSIMLFTLGVAILAGSGVATLAADLDQRDWRRLLGVQRAVGLAAMGGVLLWGALYWRAGGGALSPEAGARWSEIVQWSGFFAAMLLVALALLTVQVKVPSARRIVPYVAIVVMALDLLAVGWRAHLKERRPEDIYLPSTLIEQTMRELGPARAYDEWVLKGNHGQAYGLPTITRTFPLHLERFELATERLPQERLFELLNVRYLTTWQGPAPGRQPLGQESDATGSRYLYSRSSPGPGWIVPAVKIVPGGWEALELVAHKEFDPRTTVVVEAAEIQDPGSGGFGRVTSYERRFNSVEITAEAPGGGYLVVSEMAYPAWRAQLNGAEVPIFHADYLLQGIWLPPGYHRVVLSLQPTSFWWGLGISLGTIFGLGCFGVGVLAGARLAAPRKVLS